MKWLACVVFFQCVVIAMMAFVIGTTHKHYERYIAASFAPRDKVLIEAANRLQIPLESEQ